MNLAAWILSFYEWTSSYVWAYVRFCGNTHRRYSTPVILTLLRKPKPKPKPLFKLTMASYDDWNIPPDDSHSGRKLFAK